MLNSKDEDEDFMCQSHNCFDVCICGIRTYRGKRRERIVDNLVSAVDGRHRCRLRLFRVAETSVPSAAVLRTVDNYQHNYLLFTYIQVNQINGFLGISTHIINAEGKHMRGIFVSEKVDKILRNSKCVKCLFPFRLKLQLKTSSFYIGVASVQLDLGRIGYTTC